MTRSRLSGLIGFAVLSATIVAACPSPAFAADAYVTMSTDKRFRTWTTMINVADLKGYAQGKRPYTIFAPVEDSLANIDPDLMRAIGPKAMGRGADISQMTFVVQTHVTRGKLGSGDLAGKVSTLQSVNGRSIVVAATKSPVAVTFAGSQGAIAGSPIMTDNAIVYPVLLTAAHYTAQQPVTHSPKIGVFTLHHSQAAGSKRGASLTFAQGGYAVMGVARDPSRIGPQAGVSLRTGDASDPHALGEAIVADGPVSVLIYNAYRATMGGAGPSSIDPGALVADFRVNVAGAPAAAQAVLPAMRAARAGTITVDRRWPGA